MGEQKVITFDELIQNEKAEAKLWKDLVVDYRDLGIECHDDIRTLLNNKGEKIVRFTGHNSISICGRPIGFSPIAYSQLLSKLGINSNTFRKLTAKVRQDVFEEFIFQLLDFHRRSEKPAWWALFSRKEMTDDELIDDPECLGGMHIDPDNPPYSEKRSTIYTYSFPEQEYKLRAETSCVWTSKLETTHIVSLDEKNKKVVLKYSQSREPFEDVISIGPGGPISTTPLKSALFRFADSIIGNKGKYNAIVNLLNQRLPSINGQKSGTPIVDVEKDLLPQTIQAISNLNHSSILIQGPPGTGKTYTGSHVIVDLLKNGYKVGVSSNSHKAFNNLLSSIEKVALAEGFHFSGAKKTSHSNEDSIFKGAIIENVPSNKDVVNGSYQLIAGTFWLFSDPGLEQQLDYIFIDEAGQVALANLIAIGLSAKNLVLLGDQMQLGQPVQGTHPGRTGESSLDYVMNGIATVPLDRGIFLKTTWRMHPEVCKFISDAVYDSRLEAQELNVNQQIVLSHNAHPTLKPFGIHYVPIDHEGCSQQSLEEANVIKEIYLSLLSQNYSDRNGSIHPIESKNILVVAPYNMQVNLLKNTLPDNARIGTVDKFQGQEAEVVIVSMTTSSGDDLPRHIEFLYSKNRLNVAISRAKCLSIVIANPLLMAIKCRTIEQMALVNTLCWVKEYSDEAGRNNKIV